MESVTLPLLPSVQRDSAAATSWSVARAPVWGGCARGRLRPRRSLSFVSSSRAPPRRCVSMRTVPLVAWIGLGLAFVAVAAVAVVSARAALPRQTPGGRRRDEAAARTVIRWFQPVTAVCLIALVLTGQPLTVLAYALLPSVVLFWLGIVVAVNLSRRGARG